MWRSSAAVQQANFTFQSLVICCCQQAVSTSVSIWLAVMSFACAQRYWARSWAFCSSGGRRRSRGRWGSDRDGTEAFFNITEPTHSVGVLHTTGSSHPYKICDQLFHISQLTDSNHVHLSLVTKDLKFPQLFCWRSSSCGVWHTVRGVLQGTVCPVSQSHILEDFFYNCNDINSQFKVLC
jgi:hypothetical protein